MTRPLPARLDPSSYPYTVEIATRFGDLDTIGHVNNVAIASLFEEARFRFDQAHDCKPAVDGVKPAIVSLTLEFMRETFHPAPLQVSCGIAAIGRSSWQIHQLAMQQGQAVAISTATMVAFTDGRSLPIPESWRKGMGAVMMIQTPAAPA